MENLDELNLENDKTIQKNLDKDGKATFIINWQRKL